MDLRFDDDLVRRDTLRNFFRFISGGCHFAARGGSAKFLEELFCLIFVDVHPIAPKPCALARDSNVGNGFSADPCRMSLPFPAEPTFLNPGHRFAGQMARYQSLTKSILMKTLLLTSVSLLAAVAFVNAGPAEEKAFTDRYKNAFEAKDTATLQSFLYTTGSDPQIVGFFQMMMTPDPGSKISKIDLVTLSPAEAQKASGAQESPGGGKVCFPLKPTKKLVVEVSAKDGESTSSSKTENFVAEKDGKFVIPVPGPCK